LQAAKWAFASLGEFSEVAGFLPDHAFAMRHMSQELFRAGVSVGNSGLHTETGDMARFGQLHLQIL
jgi:hypothetical protein